MTIVGNLYPLRDRRVRGNLDRLARSVLIGALMFFTAGASAAYAQTTVTASWDRNTDAYTVGYHLYYGTAPGSYQWNVDVGDQVTAPVALSAGSVYYFVVRAYNAQNEYGPASAEATIDLRTSAPTAQITATLGANNVATVTWQTANAATASINGISVPLAGSSAVTVSATTTFTLIATAADGRAASASATVTVETATAPSDPRNMTASVAGSRVTLSWQPAATGGTPTYYLLYVGTRSGYSDVANAYNVGNVQSISGDLARGTYYARVRAGNSVGTSLSSNEAKFTIGKKLRSPTGFIVMWSGTTATLSWTASAADTAEDVPTNYVIEAGTAPGASDVARLNVGNTTTFRTQVASGNFYVRVRAQNELGESDPSNEIEVRAPGTPQAPTALTSVGSTGAVDLRWTASVGGYGATGYIIEAGSAPGLSDLARLQVGNVTRFTTTAPPGVYYVRVRAINDKGTSLPSNEVIVRR